MKNIIAFALIIWASTGGLYAETKISWVDNNDIIHYNSIVSESIVKNMIISTGKKLNKPRETRITVKQGWGCLALEKDQWTKKDYKIIDKNTAVLNVGLSDFVGAELGFIRSDENSFYILGKKGCELFHNSEHWTAEQKINGSWVAVASGVFTYVK